MVRLRMCGGLEIERDGHVLSEALVGGRQGRLVLAYLACERHRPVARDELAELLWGEQLPGSWASSLSAVVSRLRRLLTEAGLDGASALPSSGGTYQLRLPPDTVVDVEELAAAVSEAEAAVERADDGGAIESARRAEAIASKGFMRDDAEWVDRKRRWVQALHARAALARSAAHQLGGAPHRAVDAAREALALDETHEATYRRLMEALADAGERAEALRVWQRCRITLVEELGVDPSPETEAVYLAILGSDDAAARPAGGLPTGVVTFLFTDIVASSALWDQHPAEMNAALARHDELVSEVVAAHGGTLLKSKLEGDATVSVFSKATAGVTAALALLDAMGAESWPEAAAPHLRMAMHTGEAFERDGDYFGPALNRAARIRSLAGPDQVLLSQAVTELVLDHLPDGIVVRDLGRRELRGLSRGENVFELVRDVPSSPPPEPVGAGGTAFEVPPLPPALVGSGPFVGRADEVERLARSWQATAGGAGSAVFVGGEPGVGKSRLAAEVAAHAHGSGAIVLYGQCDEDLAAPLQPFIEAMRTLGPALGGERLRAVRGVDALARVVPELSELVAAESATSGADPDSERLALFDAVTQLLRVASEVCPVLLVLDDLHWAGKSTLSLLRHVLRGASEARLLVLGTYRDTELGRSHPLAATLADLRRDGFTDRVSLTGLDRADVAEYLSAVGNDNQQLGRELAEITAGNPFFVIEVLRHLEETGGTWEPGSLPEGVREATGRRLSRLSDRTNEALSVAAVAGGSFDLSLVEQIRDSELTDEIDEACRAGLVLEEAGSPGRFRFAHAIVRQVLLTELVTLKRVRLHRAIAELLEASPGRGDEDTRIADLAYHWFECASAGGAEQAVTACRRAADRAMERLAYEEAADLYGMALQALDGVDDPDREVVADVHLARCDALLTAGDVAGARGAIDALEHLAGGSERLAAWYTTYEGLLAVLGEPDRLNEIVRSIGAAASAMRAVGDLGGEAKAHYVHASALERLGQIGDAERALDAALAAARSAGDRRLADAILAEAPPAALWGPRPVTRASGTCLDVVRVLRVTQGAPAVEAVALSCQAVLEALRGRADAARRMVGSALRTFDRLGLAHRRLEAEVAAAFVELLDGEAVAAEELLRPAYDDLRRRGLDGEAAQAAAFLGRSLLLQGRVDDADAIAREAAELAGSDLRAGIGWRDVRAEVAARRGELDLALELAEEAVAMATATDALLLVADARLTLATVLEAAGRSEAADDEALRAAEACEAKGATAMLVYVRGGLRPQPEVADQSHRPDPPANPPGRAHDRGRLVMAVSAALQQALNERDYDAYRSLQAPGRVVDDRRRVVGLSFSADDVDHMKVVMADRGLNVAPELLEARGELVALSRWILRGPDYEVSVLPVIRSDAFGRRVEGIMFDEDDLDLAHTELDAMAARAAEQRFDNDAVWNRKQWQAAVNASELDTIHALMADDLVFEDRRSLLRLDDEGAALDGSNVLLVLDGTRIDAETIATRGRSLSLSRWHTYHDEHLSESEVLIVAHVDENGRVTRSVGWDPEELVEAAADLDRTFLETEAADHVPIVRALLADALRRHAVVVHLPLVSDHRALLVLRPAGSDEQWIELVTHDGVQVTSTERFPVEAYDDALVRYWDLEPTRGEGRLAMALATKVGDTLNRRDFDAYRATHSPWSRWSDHRPIVGVDEGIDEIEQLRWIMRGTARLTQPELLEARGERVALVRRTLLGDGFEVPHLSILRTDLRGRRVAVTQFDAPEREAALLALEEEAVRAEAEKFDNDAVVCMRGWRDALNRGDDGAVRELRAEGFGFADRRLLVGATLDTDGSELTDRIVIDEGGSVELEVLATRGSSLALQRWVHAVPEPESVTELLVLSRVDENGRAVAGTGFDLHALDAAMAELDRSFLETEAADHAPIVRDLLADAASRHAAIVHLPLLSEDRALLVLRSTGAEEGPWIELVTHDGVQVTSVDRFPLGAFDTALIRYWRLERPVSTTDAEPNYAVRTEVRLKAAYDDHDWAALVDVIGSGYVLEDRQSVVRVSMDRAQNLANHRIMFESGVRFERETIATRGNQLALSRWTSARPDVDATTVTLTVNQIGADGRYARTIAFDADDFEHAFAALEELHTVGPEVVHPDTPATRAEVRSEAAFNDHEWDAVRTCHGESWTMEDRRSVVSMSLGIEESVANLRLIFDGNGRFERELIATRGERLALSRWELTLPGEQAVASLLTVNLVDEEGRYERTLMFDAENLDGALTALDELNREIGGPTKVPSTRQPGVRSEEQFANRAWRTSVAIADACTRRDPTALESLAHEDFALVDHRLAAPTENMGEPGLGAMSGLLDLDEISYRRELVATRGDRLVLTRDEITFVDGVAGPAQVDCYTVMEVAADGRALCSVGFDVDALSSAYDELDRRYIALGGPDMRPYRQAWDARDLVQYGSLFAPSFLLVDRRAFGWVRFLAPAPDDTDAGSRWAARVDLDAFLEFQRAQWESADEDQLWLLHVVAHSPVASLVVGGGTGSVEGVAYEGWYLTLNVLDDRHRIAELYFYDIDELAEARAHYDRVTVPGANAAWRAVLALEDALNAGDRAGLRATFSTECVFDDRVTVSLPVTSYPDLTSTYEVGFQLDECHYRHELLDTAGDHLALVHLTVSLHDGDSGPAEVERLQVVAVDDDGRIRRQVALEVDDLEGARAAIEELAQEIESTSRASRVGPLGGPDLTRFRRDTDDIASAPTALGRLAMASMRRFESMANHRDFTAWTDNISPGRQLADRRHIVNVSYTGDDSDLMRWVMAHDVTLTHSDPIAARGERVVLTSGMLASADFEVPFLSLGRVDLWGRDDESIIFDPEDIDEARATVDEMAERAEAQRFENDASTCMRRWAAALNDGDLELARALRRDDYVYVEHRSVIGATHGADEVEATNRILVGSGAHFGCELIATRGRSLALQRWTVHVPDPEADSELLVLSYVDDEGRNFSGTGFDGSDLHAAMSELQREHAAVETDHVELLAHLSVSAARRHATIVHLPLLSEEKVLLVLQPEDGGDLWIELLTHDGAHVTSTERFGEADLDAALVRYWGLEGST